MDDQEFDKDRFLEQAAALEAAEASQSEREPVVAPGQRGTRSFILYQPIRVDGRTLTRISIRPPTGADIDDWGNGTVKSAREMLARLSGLHPAIIRGLDGVDLEIVYKMFWDMVPDWLRDTAANPGIAA